MPEPSVLSGVISFLERLGVYDVVLPFLLVFTIVFAILEKTRIFGSEGDKGQYSKKNLNSMVAFVLGFLVVASSHLVAAITQISAEIVIVLLLAVFFLLLVGSFYEPGKVEEGVKGWPRTLFIVIILLAIIFIFLRALPGPEGNSWLEVLAGFFFTVPSYIPASIILIVFIVIFIMLIVREKGGSNENRD